MEYFSFILGTKKMISVSDPPLEETIARRTAEEEEETKSSKRKSFATNQRVPAATGKEFRRLLNKFGHQFRGCQYGDYTKEGAEQFSRPEASLDW